jgi:predicted transcriptional regulator
MNDLERLQALLQRYSIRRLASETGITRTMLAAIRDGHSSPTIEVIGKIWDVVAEDAIAVSDARTLRARRTAAATRSDSV